MKYLPLTKGYSTLVDDDIFYELNKQLWYAQSCGGNRHYAAKRINAGYKQTKIVLLHHHLLGVEGPALRLRGLCVDHINRKCLDNRLCNLRIVSTQDNMLNSISSINKVGVAIDRTHETFKAYIDRPYQKRINVGTRKTREEAEALLKEALEELGEEPYAYLQND